MYAIPADPKHCRYCIGDSALSQRPIPDPVPCDDHRAPDGSFQTYSGYNLYKPSDWVQSVVGGLYTCGRWSRPAAPGQTVVILVEIFGYDPRCGFWVREVDQETKQPIPDGYFSNISERAIDRTYHRWHGRKIDVAPVEGT